MSIVSYIQHIEILPDSISMKTKKKALKELIENSRDYNKIKNIIKRKTTFNEEYNKLGCEKFLKKYTDVFPGNFDLEKNIEYIDKVIYKLYIEDDTNLSAFELFFKPGKTVEKSAEIMVRETLEPRGRKT